MQGAGGEVEPEGQGVKRWLWIAAAALACVGWGYAERKAALAEERAEDAEAWAEAVEAEAEAWMARLSEERR